MRRGAHKEGREQCVLSPPLTLPAQASWAYSVSFSTKKASKTHSESLCEFHGLGCRGFEKQHSGTPSLNPTISVLALSDFQTGPHLNKGLHV